MKIKIKKLLEKAIPPVYATKGAACFDLHAVLSPDPAETRSIPVNPGTPVVIGTGLAFEIPEGHVMLVFSRSSQGFSYDTLLANCTGIIDSDYRGEVKVKLTCDNPAAHSSNWVKPLVVKDGDRIAQAMILPYPAVEFELSEELSETDRGQGGFGSTGA